MSSEAVITCGDQKAVVSSRGGALLSYSVQGRDVVVPLRPDNPAGGMYGAVLAPWPNRLDSGRYVFDGIEHEVPINEVARNNAIHGFVHDMAWTLKCSGEKAVTASVLLEELPGYPFRMSLSVHYELDDAGLTVTATAMNLGESEAPFGIGFHPWLASGGAQLDECVLEIHASSWIMPNERLLPVGVRDIPDALDFSAPRVIAGAVLDDGFAGAIRDADGKTWIRLASPDGYTSAVWSLAPLDFWQVCSGDFPELGHFQRAGLAAEPMSCPANSFASGDHLTCLAPEQALTVSWGLCLEP